EPARSSPGRRGKPRVATTRARRREWQRPGLLARDGRAFRFGRTYHRSEPAYDGDGSAPGPPRSLAARVGPVSGSPEPIARSAPRRGRGLAVERLTGRPPSSPWSSSYGGSRQT